MTRLPRPLMALAFCSSLTLLAGADLCKAAVNGDLASAKSLIAGGEPIDEVDLYGWSPLMWAVHYRNFAVAEFLLEKGANPNIQSLRGYGFLESGATALTITGYYGLDDFAALLLKKGANPDLKDAVGKTALDYAMRYEFMEVMQLLKKAGPTSPGDGASATGSGVSPASTNAVLSPSDLPASLSEAVLKGDLGLVKGKLKAAPAELNQYDKWGWTPLLWATLRQYTPIVRFLLESGADPNLPALNDEWAVKSGATPLIICGYYGTPKIAKLLLAAKANPKVKNRLGETALSYAKQFEFKEMVDLLSDEKQ